MAHSVSCSNGSDAHPVQAPYGFPTWSHVFLPFGEKCGSRASAHDEVLDFFSCEIKPGLVHDRVGTPEARDGRFAVEPIRLRLATEAVEEFQRFLDTIHIARGRTLTRSRHIIDSQRCSSLRILSGDDDFRQVYPR